MNYWWVNQNQTYKHELLGGYLWSPKVNADGRRNVSYDNMTQVSPGDLVFSYSSTFIKAVGVATDPADTNEKPEELKPAGDYWRKEGWLVKVLYYELKQPIKPKDFFDEIKPTLPEKYSPLIEEGKKAGDGVQTFYLVQLPNEMANLLLSKIAAEDRQDLTGLRRDFQRESHEKEEEARINANPKIPPTEKEQLVLSRRGQGRFRTELERLEKKCRVTGVTQSKHLIASHVKPWRDATDKERLDGNNGLLLAPHIDHLFDKGYISFEDNGALLVSRSLNEAILKVWCIDPNTNAGLFRPEQIPYLRYHRENIFEKDLASPET
ncbi:hypothetical protein ABH15_07470 [Methanoculleus taiwanensis]|uniref:HNH nuclease domain-containing protein n=1 Tax=Methanoculleus taiwanensis TaxID=1550565 RepID=A0A498H0Z0_9EURY|nr:HNH endonuclease [Methanoculleus taiwanensis]RXE56027.1 hypothetical protein ABH15_07470 [Methanoculleus taiwanensis]